MKKIAPFLIIILLLIAGILFALTAGQFHIRLETLLDLLILKLSGETPGEEIATQAMVLWSVRLPRVLMAILAG